MQFYKSAKELDSKVKQFFSEARGSEAPVTRSALAIYLGITKDEYMRCMSGAFDTKKNVYSRVLKLAELEIERYAEELLLTRDKVSSAMMFYLKERFGWGEEATDEQDSEVNVNVKVIE